MRYHELTEAIVNRPRHMPNYLKNRIKRLDVMLAACAEADKLIKQGDDEGSSLIRSAVRYGSDGTPDYENAHDIHMLEYVNLDSMFQIYRLKEALESYLRYLSDRNHDFLKYVESSLADVDRYDADYIKQVKSALNLIQYIEKGIEVYGYEAGNPEHEADPEYIGAKQILAGFRLKQQVFNQIEILRKDLKEKLGVIRHMKNHDASLQGSHKYRPQHEDVETLYHATLYATEILRNGFSSEKPKERTGVGNFGHQELISFTHDYKVAIDILRSFKEIWMIAHRQLTTETIWSWIKHENIENEVKKAWGGMTSDGMPRGRNADPHEVVKLYRYYLSFTKLRTDPKIVSPWELIDAMEDRSIKDIGILECKVDLTGDNDYMFGEAEFRVPANKVLSVKRKI